MTNKNKLIVIMSGAILLAPISFKISRESGQPPFDVFASLFAVWALCVSLLPPVPDSSQDLGDAKQRVLAKHLGGTSSSVKSLPIVPPLRHDDSDAVVDPFTLSEHLDSVFNLVVLSGPPESGRTHVLRRLQDDLASVAASGDIKRSRVPFLVGAATWRSDYRDLADWIAYEMRQRCEIVEQTGRRLALSGDLVLLIRSIEEIDEIDTSSFMADVEKFRALSPETRIVLSTTDVRLQHAGIRTNAKLAPVTILRIPDHDDASREVAKNSLMKTGDPTYLPLFTDRKEEFSKCRTASEIMDLAKFGARHPVESSDRYLGADEETVERRSRILAWLAWNLSLSSRGRTLRILDIDSSWLPSKQSRTAAWMMVLLVEVIFCFVAGLSIGEREAVFAVQTPETRALAQMPRFFQRVLPFVIVPLLLPFPILSGIVPHPHAHARRPVFAVRPHVRGLLWGAGGGALFGVVLLRLWRSGGGLTFQVIAETAIMGAVSGALIWGISSLRSQSHPQSYPDSAVRSSLVSATLSCSLVVAVFAALSRNLTRPNVDGWIAAGVAFG